MKVSESIFSCKVGVETIILPLADVCYVEIEEWGHNIGNGKIRKRYTVVLKNNSVELREVIGGKFMKTWCYYRHEIEGGYENFIRPNKAEVNLINKRKECKMLIYKQIKRMDELVNQSILDLLKINIEFIAEDLRDEGFDPEDALEFLNNKTKSIIEAMAPYNRERSKG